jgi:hypothetical protein
MPKTEIKPDSDRRRMVIESIVEGRKMEAYAEHRTKERWLCIDCLRQLKETLDTLEQWEEELAMHKDARRQLDGDLGA